MILNCMVTLEIVQIIAPVFFCLLFRSTAIVATDKTVHVLLVHSARQAVCFRWTFVTYWLLLHVHIDF